MDTILLYKMGTIIEIIYTHDGIKEKQNIFLANTFAHDELFQVIVIEGYHVGEVDGYIEKQFSDIMGCTWEHLEQQLRKRIYGNIESIKILKQRVFSPAPPHG